MRTCSHEGPPLTSGGHTNKEAGPRRLCEENAHGEDVPKEAVPDDDAALASGGCGEGGCV